MNRTSGISINFFNIGRFTGIWIFTVAHRESWPSFKGLPSAFLNFQCQIEVGGHNIQSDSLLGKKPHYPLLGVWVCLKGGQDMLVLKKHPAFAGSETIKYSVPLRL
jgi:hypothetical protein